MARSPHPAEIEAICTKPGRVWTPQETETVCAWLLASRVRWMLAIASRCFRLGVVRVLAKVGRPVPHIDPSHIEDVVAGFFVERFAKVVAQYDPGKHGYLSNVCGCSAFLAKGLCWFAKEEGEKFARRVFEQPPVQVGPDGDEIELEPSEPGLGPDSEAIKNEQVAALTACIDELPVSLRPVMFLVLAGMTNEEIAELLDLAVGTVKNRKSMALPVLLDCLRAKGVTIPPSSPMSGRGE